MSEPEISNPSEAVPAKPLPWLKYLPGILFAVVFLLSWFGNRWGLPNDLHHQSYHPDEEVIWRYAQQVDPAKGDFTPGFYNYGTLYLTVLHVATDMTAAYVGVDPQNPWKHVGNSHFAGRIVSGLCFAGLVTVVFLMIRRFSTVFAAVCGAFLVGLSPGLVVHSRFQTTDLLATFLLALGTYFALKLFDEGEVLTKTWVLAGLFVGLSAGTKYTGVLGFLTILVAAFLAGKKDLKGLGIAFGTMLLGFVIGTPGVLLETSAFVRDFKYEMLHTSTGHGLIFEGINGFGFHVVNLIQAIGLFAVPLALVGLILMGIERKPQLWALLAFALPYFVLIGRAEVLFLRYVFPLAIILAVGFAYLVEFCHRQGGWQRIGVVAAILALGRSGAASAQYTGAMLAIDPRDQTVLALRAQSKEGDTVGLVSDPWFWSPPFFPNSTITRMAGVNNVLREMIETTTLPRPVRYLPPNPSERFDWDVRLLTEAQPTWIVFTSFEVGPVARLSSNPEALSGVPKLFVDRFIQFHGELEKQYEPVIPVAGKTLAEKYADAFSTTEDLEYVRPSVWIWKRKGTP
jgi:hypothetical protein